MFITDNQTIKISDSKPVDITIKNDANLIVEIENTDSVDMKVKVQENVKANILIFNHQQKTLDYKDEYQIYGHVNIAYVQLDDCDLTVNSNYYLQQTESSVNVRSAIIARNKKVFNINTYHNKGNTYAKIDNYGIADGNGLCQLVVTNTINKGTKGCQTFQTSRILTYSSKAIGKILPILKIDENDVQASHAASIGKPNQQAIFYLQSRGLTYQQALNLISIGYLLPVSQVVEDKVVNELIREEIERKVSQTCLM